MSVAVESLRSRLASLAGAGQEVRRPAVVRRLPRGFERIETPYGPAHRFAEVRAEGRVYGRPPAVVHAYLDTETTGLAGGTGTYAFCAALARPVAAGLEVIQLFLAEPAGEPAFLHALQDELRRTDGLGTYNGSTFDLPLLRTRWVMARMPGELQHPAHTDLLHMARALLRQRLTSCTLRSVEEALLGFERENDLPGAMVPDAYFTYLRRGTSPHLEGALEHNRQDVVSLHHVHARLLLRLDGDDPWMEAPDWLALARLLLRTGRRADGWRALRHAADLAQGPASAAAALLLARLLVRRRRNEAAALLLEAAARRQPLEPAVAIARARVLEWQLRRPADALDVVEGALAGRPSGAARADLEGRRERLRRKTAVKIAGKMGRGQPAVRRSNRQAESGSAAAAARCPCGARCLFRKRDSNVDCPGD